MRVREVTLSSSFSRRRRLGGRNPRDCRNIGQAPVRPDPPTMDRHFTRSRKNGSYSLIRSRRSPLNQLPLQLEKYKKADFGRCPRVLCHAQPLLPCGLTDLPYEKPVKLYCPRCEDLYSPKSSRHGSIDGAYFGSTFPHMFMMVYSHMLPSKAPPDGPSTTTAGGPTIPRRLEEPAREGRNAAMSGNVSTAAAASKAERYSPKIFGFKINEIAKLQRWQGAVRDR